MNYETIPTTVEAHQQQLVSAVVHTGPNDIVTARPSDWIVKWPDGRLEVFTADEFRNRFRPSNKIDVSRVRLGMARKMEPDRTVVTFGDNPGLVGGVNPDRRPNGY